MIQNRIDIKNDENNISNKEFDIKNNYKENNTINNLENKNDNEERNNEIEIKNTYEENINNEEN